MSTTDVIVRALLGLAALLWVADLAIRAYRRLPAEPFGFPPIETGDKAVIGDRTYTALAVYRRGVDRVVACSFESPTHRGDQSIPEYEFSKFIVMTRQQFEARMSKHTPSGQWSVE